MTTPAAAEVDDLFKTELLKVLEHVPQHFWPPRPTRQSKGEILRSIRQAIAAGGYTFNPEHLQ